MRVNIFAETPAPCSRENFLIEVEDEDEWNFMTYSEKQDFIFDYVKSMINWGFTEID